MSIITYPLNNVTYQAADAELYNCTRTSGVWGLGDNLGVSAVNGMSITIAPGLAWIKNTDFAGKCVGVTAPVTLTLSPADNTNPRIDRIVLRFTTAANATEMIVKEGTPAASPVPVAREATAQIYELVLYDILVPAASASIATGSITDQRANPDLCGIMRDAVEGAVPDSRKINGYPLVDDINLTASDVGVDLSAYLKRSGGTMTGALTLNSDPTAAMHAATKQYIDNAFGASAKIITGVYTGTGTYGSGSPNSITCGFTPVFGIVYNLNASILRFGLLSFGNSYDTKSRTITITKTSLSSFVYDLLSARRNGTNAQWYHTGNENDQLNFGGSLYQYVIWGV